MTVSSAPGLTSRPSPSFASIIEAAKAGGEWAFEHLFVTYQPPLLRYLRGQAADIADDVASETWLAAARGIRGFTGEGDDFRAWLFTIARHRLIDERRRESRRPRLTLLGGTEHLDTAGPSSDAAIGDAAAQQIVALLPADQAEVILLRVVADLSVEHVARIVGKKTSHVRVLQHRGLKKLAEKLVTE